MHDDTQVGAKAERCERRRDCSDYWRSEDRSARDRIAFPERTTARAYSEIDVQVRRPHDPVPKVA